MNKMNNPGENSDGWIENKHNSVLHAAMNSVSDIEKAEKFKKVMESDQAKNGSRRLQKAGSH